MNDVVITCGCGNTNEFAKDAFKLLFPNQKFPILLFSKVSISMFADGQGKEVKKYFNAIIDTDDKYAYYAKIENGKIIELWNLLKGIREL